MTYVQGNAPARRPVQSRDRRLNHLAGAHVLSGKPAKCGEAVRVLEGGSVGGRSDAGEELIEALYREHAGQLFAVALRLTGDRGRAGEVVQETFLRAWQHPEALDGRQGSVRAWLFTVARNVVTDLWRRDAARPRIAEQSADTLAGDDELDRAVESWQVADALRGLSADHRTVLFHAFYCGRSVRETAAALGVPAGTVKSRTFYALRALRLALEEMGINR